MMPAMILVRKYADPPGRSSCATQRDDAARRVSRSIYVYSCTLITRVTQYCRARRGSRDTKWATAVAQPALALGKSTMKHLSAGWGIGTAFAFLVCWIISFANFLMLVHNSLYEDEYVPLKHGTTCLIFALLPLVISADVAHVSSMCDELLNTINELKMTWSSTKEAQEIHARVFPLQTTLLSMNQGQGLGVSFQQR
eukprot:COSAG02_NODE_5458_length_4302_cov_1.659291_5_plen_197_part_00